MRIGKRGYCVLGLVAISCTFWFLGDRYPDQVFSAYLNTRRRIEAFAHKQEIPRPWTAPPGWIAQFESYKFDRPLPKTVVLPAGEAVLVENGRFWNAHLPQTAPVENVDTWRPTAHDIARLEARLRKISTLKPENYATGSQVVIDRPATYFRQYAGVQQKGKKLIYVNAFCSADFDLSDWQQHLVGIDDGGTCAWQALYDPAKDRFFRVKANGIA